MSERTENREDEPDLHSGNDAGLFRAGLRLRRLVHQSTPLLLRFEPSHSLTALLADHLLHMAREARRAHGRIRLALGEDAPALPEARAPKLPSKRPLQRPEWEGLINHWSLTLLLFSLELQSPSRSFASADGGFAQAVEAMANRFETELVSSLRLLREGSPATLIGAA